MSDIDNYLLKCTLEQLDKQFGEVKKSPEEIVEECTCKYGYKN